MTVEMILVSLAILPGLLLLAELTASLLNKNDEKSLPLEPQPEDECRLAVIMPAHNEQAVVETSVRSIQNQLSEGDLLVVVADNCTDATAQVVRALDLDRVVVLERSNLEQRGKGFALDHGYEYVKQQGFDFDLLGVIDADCQFSGDDAVALIKKQAQKADLFQVGYLMSSNSDTSLVSSFAWYLKTASRSVGMDKLFGACHIQGSGFFISAKVAHLVNFASGSIVEDLELGLNMAANRVFCKYVPSVTLVSEMPGDVEILQTQKSRWEVGHLKVLLEEALPRALQAVKQFNFRYLLLVCDLSVPPLVTYLAGLALLLSSLLIMGMGSSIYLFVYLLSIVPLIYWHWRKYCEGFGVELTFNQIVSYLMIKFKVITNYSNKKSRAWNKTER